MKRRLRHMLTTLSRGVGPVNLALFPSAFDNAAWAKNGTSTPTVTANTAVAPDGATIADTITFGALGVGNAGGYVYQARDVFLPNITYEISCYVKTASGTKAFRFATYDGNAEHQSADKTATTTWQLFTYSFTADALTTAGQDYGIRNAVGGGAGDIIVSGFFLRRL